MPNENAGTGEDQNIIPMDSNTEQPEDEDWETVAGGDGESEAGEEPTKDDQEPGTTQDENFWRNEYQQFVESTKQHDPDYAEQWLSQRRQERKAPSEPEPEISGMAEFEEEASDYVSKADLHKVVSEIKGLFTQQQQQQEQARQVEAWKAEYNSADRALKEFATKHKIPTQVWEQAAQEVAAYGIDVGRPGGPSGYARAMTKELITLLRQGSVSAATAQAVSQAEQKALQAKMAEQPGGASAGMPGEKKQTKEDKILAALRAVDSSETADEVFGD